MQKLTPSENVTESGRCGSFPSSETSSEASEERIYRYRNDLSDIAARLGIESMAREWSPRLLVVETFKAYEAWLTAKLIQERSPRTLQIIKDE